MEHAAQEYKIVIVKIGFLLMKNSGRSVQYVLLALGIEPWVECHDQYMYCFF